MSTTVLVTLSPVTCCVCGVIFGLTHGHEAELRRTHADFYCPNGHVLAFNGRSKVERERDAALAKAQQAENDAKWERDRAERANRRAVSAEMSRRVTKGHLTRIKRRVAAGVCPKCNRTFTNLARHMKGQHPEFGHDCGVDHA